MPIQPTGASHSSGPSQTNRSSYQKKHWLPACYERSLQSLTGAVERLHLAHWTQIQLADGRTGLFGNADAGKHGNTYRYFQFIEVAMHDAKIPFERFGRWLLIRDPIRAKQIFKKAHPGFDFCPSKKDLSKEGRDIIAKNSKYFANQEVEKIAHSGGNRARREVTPPLARSVDVRAPAAAQHSPLVVSSGPSSVSPPPAPSAENLVPESLISAMLSARREILLIERQREEIDRLLSQEQATLQNLLHSGAHRSAPDDVSGEANHQLTLQAPSLKRRRTDVAHSTSEAPIMRSKDVV